RRAAGAPAAPVRLPDDRPAAPGVGRRQNDPRVVKEPGMKLGRFGLLALVLLAGCPTSDQKWARSKAEGFLKNVFEGNLEAAKAYTVPDFKYGDYLTTIEVLKGRSWQITTERNSPQDDEAFFEGTWDTGQPKRGTFLVRVVKNKEDGKWRVDMFSAHKD